MGDNLVMKSKYPRDNIHMSWRSIDGFNKSMNFFISPREPGKTDTTWWEKIYSQWLFNKKPWGYLVRQVVEITEPTILDIQDILNKWSPEPVEFKYNKGNFKDGMVDIKIGDELFIRIVALSITLKRLKSAKIPNIGGIFFDEYIINPKSGEKYLPDEFFKIKEVYTTWRREFQGEGFLKLYVAGNPYSLFNPLFVGLGVDIAQLRKDIYEPVSDEEIEYRMPDGITFKEKIYKCKHNIYVGHTYAIEWGVLHPVLKQWLIEKNPFYQFDEEYNQYALEGTAINDRNIKLDRLPKNFYLEFVLRVQGKNIGIFKNNYVEDLQDNYFCKFLDEVSARRTIYCFDFDDMMDRTILMSINERGKLQRFKESIRKRLVSFEDVNVYYYIEEVYKNI